MEESSKKNGNNRTFDTNKTAPYWQNNLMQYPFLVIMDLHKMNPKFFNSLLFKSQLTANDSLRCCLIFQCQHYQARWGSALSVLHDRWCGLIQAFLRKDKWLCWTFCSLSECSLKPHLSLEVETNHVNSLWQSRDKAKIFGLWNEHVWFFFFFFCTKIVSIFLPTRQKGAPVDSQSQDKMYYNCQHLCSN